MRILCVGPQWRGSNAAGLFRAILRKGYLVDIVDEFYYLSLNGTSFLTKVIHKLIRQKQIREFNDEIKYKVDIFSPHILLVYKGAFVLPETLRYAKQKGIKLILFYPDVSFTNHGKYIPLNMPFYEHVFTTKTFAIDDLKRNFGFINTHFIPHGFDPEVHRIINIKEDEKQIFDCDASFIGTWSHKKERYLSYLKEHLPELKLKIWGSQWNKNTSASLRDSVQNSSILGDLYAIAIQSSRINLGILSEQVKEASSGNIITSRTFHIPGAGGFLLHERNEESVQYFKEGVEAGFFDCAEELVEKVKYYLENKDIREQTRLNGYRRGQNYSLDNRADELLKIINS